MQHYKIPTCFFPSTTVFLDDNRDFLLNFVLQLDEEVAYRIFDNPSKALDYIHHKHCEFEFLNQRYLNEYYESKPDMGMQTNFRSDLAVVHAEVYNPNRFAELSVVVVDYAMPGMDGLEFCRRIENPNIKKILLSGQADEKLAVEAFNEGLIDRYIKKNETNAAELIIKSIYELQQQYFQSMSDAIERMLSIKTPACLSDKHFMQFFQGILEANGIIEYYLADHSGSFFMLDEDANTSFLIVKNEYDMNACQELASAHGASQKVIEELTSRRKIPGLWASKVLNTSAGDWISCLLPAQKLDAPYPYYYAYLRGNDLFSVRQPKILSYNRYMEELDAEELLMG
ncbi:response regulator [Legionella impletisoli]|uniref:Response regulator n=1 Tax=Legionella impletisoli TaxID=343510 RepID=A0A917JVH3_9GAMM|nr:response regulator [Legionella impletisoli]GGI89173.1 response regulator [Legionella impletisoli]